MMLKTEADTRQPREHTTPKHMMDTCLIEDGLSEGILVVVITGQTGGYLKLHQGNLSDRVHTHTHTIIHHKLDYIRNEHLEFLSQVKVCDKYVCVSVCVCTSGSVVW